MRISLAQLTLPGARLGAEDPLPVPDRLLESPYDIGTDLPEQIRQSAAEGRPRSMHPYLLQSAYDRVRTPVTLPTVVLENGRVRACVVPALGGRLWSLVDQASNRELVHANQVLQPANLALRGAWFAGGVEWNIGTKGHTAHTMAPVHAAIVAGPGGAPMLRLWEFDRLREVIFQIDMWLPTDARALHVYVRIQNVNDHPVPMYWWSNAAVPQPPDLRVLAPSASAYATRYDGVLEHVAIPAHEGVDRTWPARGEEAADLFFDTAATEHPWVAAVDGTGHGLAQISTDRLVGRKLFLWGSGPGGRRWQEWLSPQNPTGYAEIQAGLTTTQFEHAMMPARESWDWLEVYGDADAVPSLAHSDDWSVATDHLAHRVRSMVGATGLERALEQARACADNSIGVRLARGGGWGSLAALDHDRRGRPWLPEPTGTPFPSGELGPEQELWSALITDPARAQTLLVQADVSVPPPSYVNGGQWEERLTTMPPSWLRDYHLGVLAHARGEQQRAHNWYASSLACAQNAWALRGEALLAQADGEHARAATLLRRALVLVNTEPTLLIEAVSASLAAVDPAGALALIDAAPERLREIGRVRLLEGFAAVAAGDRARAVRLLARRMELPDVREGEVALSDLWHAAHPGRAVPEQYDFRMRRAD